MARARTLTKLPLDRWAQLMGLNPMHFNGVYSPTHAPTVCEQPWMQRADQAVDRVGREDVAIAIARAEANIERYLGFRLLPSWEVDEWQPTQRPRQPEAFNLRNTDVRGYASVVKPRWGWLIAGGIRGKAVIQAGRPIVYTDEDGDGYNETATVTATVTAGQSACEVRVFMPASVLMPIATAGDDRFEIRPIEVSVAGTTATIVFRREQAVLPKLQEDYVPPVPDSHLRGVDGSDNANFLTTVDVYRVYNDPQTQVSFLWEPSGSGACGCGTEDCQTCNYTTQTGCLMIRGAPRNASFSMHPADWNATTSLFDTTSLSIGSSPDLARLYYYAGYRDESVACPKVQMSFEMETAVAYYAAALLERGVCECSNVHDFIKRWQSDFFTSNDDGPLVGTPPDDAQNPLGTTRGALEAWRFINREEVAKGHLVYV